MSTSVNLANYFFDVADSMTPATVESNVLSAVQNALAFPSKYSLSKNDEDVSLDSLGVPTSYHNSWTMRRVSGGSTQDNSIATNIKSFAVGNVTLVTIAATLEIF